MLEYLKQNNEIRKDERDIWKEECDMKKTGADTEEKTTPSRSYEPNLAKLHESILSARDKRLPFGPMEVYGC